MKIGYAWVSTLEQNLDLQCDALKSAGCERVDLLLFHGRLRCLVAIELKIGEFQPEFVRKM